jgi:hypothetical protein
MWWERGEPSYHSACAKQFAQELVKKQGLKLPDMPRVEPNELLKEPPVQKTYTLKPRRDVSYKGRPRQEIPVPAGMSVPMAMDIGAIERGKAKWQKKKLQFDLANKFLYPGTASVDKTQIHKGRRGFEEGLERALAAL